MPTLLGMTADGALTACHVRFLWLTLALFVRVPRLGRLRAPQPHAEELAEASPALIPGLLFELSPFPRRASRPLCSTFRLSNTHFLLPDCPPLSLPARLPCDRGC